MKVVHLNTADFRGGASKMVFRLHHGLRSLGVDSAYHVRKKLTDDDTIEEVGSGEARFAEHVVKKHLIDKKRSEVTASAFTFTWDPAGGSFAPSRYAGMDAVHLHWVERFLSPRDLAGIFACGRPVVWTVHDQKPATGGCHWSYDCRGYESDCRLCPQLADDPFFLPGRVLAMKKDLFKDVVVTMVAPSEWMAGVLRESALFREKDIRVIPHGIETDVFSAGDARSARKALGLAPDTRTLLFTAFNTDAPQKGLPYLVETLEICRGDRRFRELASAGKLELLVVGKAAAPLRDPGLPVRSFGYVESRKELAEIFRAADVLVNPTLAESFSLVSLEAMACETAVAAFRTGGLQDFVDAGTGVLVDTGDAGALAATLLELLFDDEKRKGLQERAAERAGACSIEGMARSYRDLYEELATKDALPAAPEPDVRDSFRDVIAAAALMETEELLGVHCGAQGASPEQALRECIAKNGKSLQRQRPELYRRMAELAEK